MKKRLFLAAATLMASCSQGLKVEVTNPTRMERDDETVEIAWSEIASIEGVTPENVAVLDDEGREVPSQVVYFGEEQPQALIFQVDAQPMHTERFTIRKATGPRDAYPVQAYGRHVPERYDDYAWENDKVAYRLYGPALETSPERLVTPGIDAWVKCTDKLVIDEWYAKGNYHHNEGDGMDCYKVGRTLGAGASAPFVEGKLWLSRNYATQKTLDNGPLRTTVRLTYAPFDANECEVTLTKTITLDAGTRFNRMEDVYEGAFEELPVAAGFVRHDVKDLRTGEGWLGMVEAASDSENPEADGDIYFGIVLPEARMLPDSAGHALAVKRVKPGEKLVYYAGTGWSNGGVEGMDEWVEEIARTNAAATAPLQVTIR